jgi:Raf kinase inhibitor-like YbhB/YbcL family protein
MRWLPILLAVALLFAACGDDEEDVAPKPTSSRTSASVTPDPDAPTITLESEAFQEGETIPVQFTCEGANVSPALSWSDPPEGTASFTLIVDDPDAPGGTFTHWVLFDLPPDTRSLPQGVEVGERPAAGGVQGTNDGNRVGYTGPCPPPGDSHRYIFTLYALDALLELAPGATKDDVAGVFEEHILAEAPLTGTFAR